MECEYRKYRHRGFVKRRPAREFGRNLLSSSRSVLADTRLLDEQVHGRECEHLAVRRLKQPAHVLAPDLESAPGDAGDHIVSMAGLVTECPQPHKRFTSIACLAFHR